MTILPEAATDIASWVFILIAVLVVVAGAALFFVGRRKRADFHREQPRGDEPRLTQR